MRGRLSIRKPDAKFKTHQAKMIQQLDSEERLKLLLKYWSHIHTYINSYVHTITHTSTNKLTGNIERLLTEDRFKMS